MLIMSPILRIAVALLVSVLCLPTYAAEPTLWTAQSDFFHLPDGYKLGACSAAAVNGRGEIFVFHRGEHPILVFDSAGKFLRSFGDGAIAGAHGLRIDKNDDLWVTDI